MAFIEESAWLPVGVDALEPNAWDALRARENVSVVAGPGAGKTEFLAQKASFLLQSGRCPPPYRILAISFKRDAAETLKKRVESRCPPEQAQRFVSLTFDSFTKGLLDRFRPAVPELWRPEPTYEIAFFANRDIGAFLSDNMGRAPVQYRSQANSINSSVFESRYVGSTVLDALGIPIVDGSSFLVAEWWKRYCSTGKSKLTFVMINRLVELLVRSCPKVLSALRLTYPVVFIDEFQDTTHAQYGLLKTLFHCGGVSITAVGDDKQRIMAWAGAKVDAFECFSRDFEASCVQLISNFRSSTELVAIQQVVALAIESNAVESIARKQKTADGDAAQIWNCASVRREAERLAQWISDDMYSRNTAPRDYGLLVRQRPDDFENELGSAFSRVGLVLRNESKRVGRTTIQELFAEPLTDLVIAFLRLLVERRNPRAWRVVIDSMTEIRGVDPKDEEAALKVEQELSRFLQESRAYVMDTSCSKQAAGELLGKLFEFLNPSNVKACIPAYAHGEAFDIAWEGIQALVEESVSGEDWAECVNRFAGRESVPLMTVHKSKGMEFDTMIFLGLDDSSWWAFTRDNPEGLSTFFVGLSRAKQRAIFTYCSQRGQRRRVDDLYELLKKAGVEEFSF